MAMIQSRNLTSHTYNETTADEIATAILDSFVAQFDRFREQFAEREKKEP